MKETTQLGRLARGVVAALLLTGVAPLSAEDTGPGTSVLGVGNQSCGVWLENERSKNDDRYILRAWLGGFLSALNATGYSGDKDLTEGMNVTGLDQWVSNYCAANPLNTVARASAELAKELKTRQGK